MQASEFADFESVIHRLEKLFGKTLDDDAMQGYWGALKDQPIGVVRKFAELHSKNAKFFPKPFELRPKEEKKLIRDAATDAAFREGEDRAIRGLEEMRMHNPEEWLDRMGNNNAARLHRENNGAIYYDLSDRCWRLA